VVLEAQDLQVMQERRDLMVILGDLVLQGKTEWLVHRVVLETQDRLDLLVQRDQLGLLVLPDRLVVQVPLAIRDL